VFNLQKQYDVYLLKLIEYIKHNHMFNIAKNEWIGKKKNSTSKLIAYNDKMPTNNIKSKWLEHQCFRSARLSPKSLIEFVIDRNWYFNKYQTKNETRREIKQRRTMRQTTENHTQTTKLRKNKIPHLEDEIMKKYKKNLISVKTDHLLKRIAN